MEAFARQWIHELFAEIDIQHGGVRRPKLQQCISFSQIMRRPDYIEPARLEPAGNIKGGKEIVLHEEDAIDTHHNKNHRQE